MNSLQRRLAQPEQPRAELRARRGWRAVSPSWRDDNRHVVGLPGVPEEDLRPRT
jgi:hypothetical protein